MTAPDIVLIILNVLTLLMNEFLFLISQSSATVIGNAYLAVLVINTTLYTLLFVSTRLFSYYTLRKLRPIPIDNKNQFVSSLLLKVTAWIGGLCYLGGSNIRTIFALNASDFDCDETCQDKISETSTLLLVMASLLFTINEICSGKILLLLRSVTHSTDTGDDEDDKFMIWARTAECIAFIRVFDSSFTTVASLPESIQRSNTIPNGALCSTHEEVIIWFMYVLLLIIWAIVLIIIMSPGIAEAIRGRNMKSIIQTCLVTLTIFFATETLLMGGNLDPLGCEFNCNIYSANFTIECDTNGFHATRYTTLLVSFLLLAPLCFCLFVRWLKLTAEFGSLGSENAKEMNTLTGSSTLTN